MRRRRIREWQDQLDRTRAIGGDMRRELLQVVLTAPSTTWFGTPSFLRLSLPALATAMIAALVLWVGHTPPSVVDLKPVALSGRLTVWFVNAPDRARDHTSRYGKRVLTRGVLRTRDGRGIRGARIDVYHILDGKRRLLKTGLKTGPGGTLTLILPMNVDTRTLEFAYRALRPGPITSRQRLRLTVMHNGRILHHRPRRGARNDRSVARPIQSLSASAAVPTSRSAEEISNVLRNAHLRVWFVKAPNRGHRYTSRYGTHVVTRGVLRTRDGRGIRGARIDVYHILDGKRRLLKTGLKTGSGGTLTLILPMNVDTRTIEFAYRALRPGPITSRQHLYLTVMHNERIVRFH